MLSLRKGMNLMLIYKLCEANHILTHQQMMLLTKHQEKMEFWKRRICKSQFCECLQDMWCCMGICWGWTEYLILDRLCREIMQMYVIMNATGVSTFIGFRWLLFYQVWELMLYFFEDRGREVFLNVLFSLHI